MADRLRSADEITVSIAVDEEGEEIGRLARANNFEFDGWDIDWSSVFPSWLVAKWNGEIVGALQVLPGRPIGRMEFMSIDPDQPLRVRAIAVRKLLNAGLFTLNHHGCEGAAGTIPYDLVGYKEVLENMGGMSINEGWIMLGRTG